MAGPSRYAIQVLPCPRPGSFPRVCKAMFMTDPNRRAVLAFGAVLALAPSIALTAPKPPVVLFVCPAGTAKSAIARELFRKRARDRKSVV